MNESCQLRAIIAPMGADRLQAQVLELDIAVSGANVDELIAEIQHAIIVSYDVAMECKEAPFALISEAPASVKDKWTPGTQSESKGFHLPDNVAMALATALRKRKPIKTIEFERAA